MIGPVNLEFVLFDMIGTTIKDSYHGQSLILDSFYKAFSSNEIELSIDRIKKERGKIKKEAIRNILNDLDSDHELIEVIYSDFLKLLNSNLNHFSAMDGASEVFKMLKNQRIKIGLGSGLPLSFIYRLIEHLGWQTDSFDYLNSSEELGKGRPNPLMVIDSMKKLGLNDNQKVLKIGDTIVDVQEGKNAGVLTAGLLSGTFMKEEFEKYTPDFIFEKLIDLKNII